MNKSPVAETLPLADDSTTADNNDNRRLWIGNLDARLTEFALLKSLQKYGTLEKFDFLYHKTGPDQGKSRGYCFVSYTNKQDAEKVLKILNGKLALSKRLVVRWAHREEDQDGSNSKLTNKQQETSIDSESSDSKIRAIEMKLKHMERTQTDFSLSTRPAAPPGSSKYSSVKMAEMASQNKYSSKPYSRNESKR